MEHLYCCDVIFVSSPDGHARHFCSFGRLPFSREIRQFNLDRISMSKLGVSTDTISVVERDVLQIPR